jgi:hypothetical protein
MFPSDACRFSDSAETFFGIYGYPRVDAAGPDIAATLSLNPRISDGSDSLMDSDGLEAGSFDCNVHDHCATDSLGGGSGSTNQINPCFNGCINNLHER